MKRVDEMSSGNIKRIEQVFIYQKIYKQGNLIITTVVK